MSAGFTTAMWSADEASEPVITLVVQVAGKVRDRLQLPAGSSQETVLAEALKSEGVQRALGGAQPGTIHFVPDTILSLTP